MTEVSKNARIAGALYILASAVGFVGLIYVPGRFIVHGNAATTASNIAQHELLFRWGILSYLVGGVLWLFVPLALYRMLKGVDQTLAVLMVILGSLMQVPAYMVNTAIDAVVVILVRGADFLSVFDKPQREALAMVFLQVHGRLDTVNLIWAGLWLLPFGVLVYKSRLLPRFLGAWLIVAGFAWLAITFTGLLLPDHQSKVFEFAQPFTLGEVVVMLWLVIMGAKEPRVMVMAEVNAVAIRTGD